MEMDSIGALMILANKDPLHFQGKIQLAIRKDLHMVKNISVSVVIDCARFTQTHKWTTIKTATISDRVAKEAVLS